MSDSVFFKIFQFKRKHGDSLSNAIKIAVAGTFSVFIAVTALAFMGNISRLLDQDSSPTIARNAGILMGSTLLLWLVSYVLRKHGRWSHWWPSEILYLFTAGIGVLYILILLSPITALHLRPFLQDIFKPTTTVGYLNASLDNYVFTMFQAAIQVILIEIGVVLWVGASSLVAIFAIRKLFPKENIYKTSNAVGLFGFGVMLIVMLALLYGTQGLWESFTHHDFAVLVWNKFTAFCYFLVGTPFVFILSVLIRGYSRTVALKKLKS